MMMTIRFCTADLAYILICISNDEIIIFKQGGARSLHIAAKHGHAGMISKLLEKGEKVDAATNVNIF